MKMGQQGNRDNSKPEAEMPCRHRQANVRTWLRAQRVLSVTSVATTCVTASSWPVVHRAPSCTGQGRVGWAGGSSSLARVCHCLLPCLHHKCSCSPLYPQPPQARTLSASCHSGCMLGSLQSSGTTRLNSTHTPARTACRAARSSGRTSAAPWSAAQWRTANTAQQANKLSTACTD